MSLDKYPRFLKTYHPPPTSLGLLESNQERPLPKLKIEYIHGCSKKGCYGNVFHINDAQHLVYPAAGCGVVLNLEDNSQKIFCKHDDDVVAMAKHPNGKYFASGQMGKNDMIYIWDSYQPEAGPIKELKTSTHFKNGGVLTCCFSNDGSKLACVGGNPKMNTILIYDWNKGTCLANVKGTNDEVYALCFSKDDTNLYLCGKNSFKYYSVSNLQSKNCVFRPKGSIQNVHCICLDDNGNAIVGVEDGSIYVFTGNNIVFAHEKAHSGAVYSVSRYVNGFVSGGKDGIVKFWSFSKNNQFTESSSVQLGSAVKNVASNDSGDIVFASKSNGDLERIQNKSTNTLISISHFGNHLKELWGLALFKGSSLFATASDDGRVIIWNTETRKHICQVRVTSLELRAVAVSPDHTHIATTTKEGTLFVLNFSKNKIFEDPIVKRKDSIEEIAALQYSEDGSLLVAGSHDNFIYVYDVKKGYRLMGKLKGHSSFVKHIDLSKNNQYIRSNSGDYEILLWDVASMTQSMNPNIEDIEWQTNSCTLGYNVRGVWKSNMDGSDINCIDVDLSKKLVAVGTDECLVSLYNYPCSTVGAKAVSYIGHCSHVTNVKFSVNNKFLSCGGGDLTTIQWCLDTDSYGSSVVTMRFKSEEKELGSVSVEEHGIGSSQPNNPVFEKKEIKEEKPPKKPLFKRCVIL